MPRFENPILVVDVGGTHVKILLQGSRRPRKIPSGPAFTPQEMIDAVTRATVGWAYARVAMGYPGPVVNGQPLRDPVNLGPGWTSFDYPRAFGHPVRMINDAAMQALGSYDGGRMLFLGLGTGLGTALVLDGVLQPTELSHLPYKHGRDYEHCLGRRGLERLGKRKWRHEVAAVVALLKDALQVDYVVLGGGNVKKLGRVPAGARLGSNAHAFRGGFRLWELPPRKNGGRKEAAYDQAQARLRRAVGRRWIARPYRPALAARSDQGTGEDRSLAEGNRAQRRAAQGVRTRSGQMAAISGVLRAGARS